MSLTATQYGHEALAFADRARLLLDDLNSKGSTDWHQLASLFSQLSSAAATASYFAGEAGGDHPSVDQEVAIEVNS